MKLNIVQYTLFISEVKIHQTFTLALHTTFDHFPKTTYIRQKLYFKSYNKYTVPNLSHIVKYCGSSKRNKIAERKKEDEVKERETYQLSQ